MLEVRATDGDTAWFVHDRFGLFIHWGLYALPARREWVKHTEEIPDEVYDKYFHHFDPDLYEPSLWAQAAWNAGMKYTVVTTKHHDGFCLWDSKLTDYKATNTPVGRDVLRPMVKAFRQRNMRMGFYHSLIDWHHPHYQVDPYNGPYRNSPDLQKINTKRDHSKYVEYLHGQVRELLTDFGTIDILWFDFSFQTDKPDGKGREAWQSEKLYKLVRKLQPHIILNDRLDLPYGWDIKTPEQFQPLECITVDGQPVVWEACQTFSGSWGYHRDDNYWKTVDQLICMLIDTVSKGGNLLLNVGPTGRGEFDERTLSCLADIGEWMKRHNRSIYGCTQAPDQFKTPQDCRLTYNPVSNRLYVHVFAWPFRYIHMDGLAGRVGYAQLLNDASEVKTINFSSGQAHKYLSKQLTKDMLTLELPIQKPNVAIPVIELFLK